MEAHKEKEVAASRHGTLVLLAMQHEISEAELRIRYEPRFHAQRGWVQTSHYVICRKRKAGKWVSKSIMMSLPANGIVDKGDVVPSV